MTIASNSVNVFAGQLHHSLSGGTGVAAGMNGIFTTFCADATQYVTSIELPYSVTGIGALPVAAGYSPMSTVAGKVQGVYNLYAAAGGAQIGSGANADLAAAFQIALWEIVYDFNGTLASLNTNAGVMQVRQTSGLALSGAILSYLNTFFDAIANNQAAQSGLMGLASAGGQDQIVMVPLPAPVLLGAAGLGLVAVARRRYR